MTLREEIEAQLSEMTQEELAQLVLIGAAMLRRLQGGEGQPFFFIKVDQELLGYWSGPMADVMQAGINRLMHTHGGQQVEVKK
jgi:hypothetical protein